MDLLDDEVFEALLKDIDEGVFVGGVLQPPCGPRSRARNNPGEARPLADRGAFCLGFEELEGEEAMTMAWRMASCGTLPAFPGAGAGVWHRDINVLFPPSEAFDLNLPDFYYNLFECK